MRTPTISLELAKLRARYRADGLWAGVAVTDGLEAVARQNPERVAVIDNRTQISYGELALAVARAVRQLHEVGVRAGSSVLTIAALDIPGVISYLASVRCGAVAVMLDRRCGASDVAHALLAVEPVALIARTHDERLVGLPAGVTHLNMARMGTTGDADHDFPEPSHTEPCAVFFTSGTTKAPKGVVHCLDTLRSGAANMALTLGFGEADAAFLSTPLAGITGVIQMHLALDRGARLILEDEFRPESSVDRMIEHGATTIGGAPVIVEALFRECQRRSLARLPLRTLALGGTMIPQSLLNLAVESYGIRPSRIYGSSEAPVSTASAPEDDVRTRLGDDGAPMPGVELGRDEITGELLIRGPNLMLGYLDEHDHTAGFTDTGWLRTGDIADVGNGRLKVTGRLKEVVSRKGMKLSLTEIDEVIRALPGGLECVAYGTADETTGERLVIAVHTDDPDLVNFEAVTSWLLDAGLAKWKLPEEIVYWDEPFPRTASGKLQRAEVARRSSGRPREVAGRLAQTAEQARVTSSTSSAVEGTQ